MGKKGREEVGVSIVRLGDVLRRGSGVVVGSDEGGLVGRHDCWSELNCCDTREGNGGSELLLFRVDDSYPEYIDTLSQLQRYCDFAT